jgi:hypothetical protein
MMKSCACACTRRRLDLGLGGAGLAKGDVLRNRAAEEKNILLDDRNLPAQRLQIPGAHIDAVDRDRAAVGVVDAIDQLGDRALARTRLPDQRQRLPGASVKETSSSAFCVASRFHRRQACTES